MADAQVAIDVLARDRASRVLEAVGNKVEQSGKKAETAKSKWQGLGSSFSKVGTIVGGEVGEVFNKLGEGMDVLNEKQGKLGKSLVAGGGVVTGIGMLLQTIGSKDKAALQQFNAAVDATGKGFEGLDGQVEKAVKSGEKYGHKAPDTIEALRKLTQATNDPKVALKELSVVEDLAAAKHESLSDAAQQLAKVHGGAGKILREFNIQMANGKAIESAYQSAMKQRESAVTQLSHAQRTLADIEAVNSNRMHLTIGQEMQLRDARQAVAAATTAAAAGTKGSTERLAKARQHLADVETILAQHGHLTIGQQIQLRNAHDAVANATENLQRRTAALTAAHSHLKAGTHASTDAISQLGAKVKGQAAAATDTFGGRMDVLRAKITDTAAVYGQKFGGAVTAAGPIMMAAGAAAQLLAARKEALAVKTAAAAVATEGETVAVESQGIIAKTTAAAQWLLNAAMDANPVMLIVIGIAALAAGLIYAYKHSETFRHALDAVGHAFGWLWGEIQKGFGWVKGHWPLLLAILVGPIGIAVYEIHQHWDSIIGFFKKIPGRIGSALSGMWDGLTDGFRTAINWIIDKWNNFHLTLGGGSVLGHKLPSITLNTPDIPHLAAGGIVPKTPGGRLIVAGDGPTDEAVVPLDGRHGGGGPVHVHLHMPPGTFVGDEAKLARHLEELLAKLQNDRGRRLDFIPSS